MDITQMGTVLAIVVISYLVGLGAKLFPTVPDKAIPVIVGITGGVLGVVGMYVMPDFPANDVITAGAVGTASGFSATAVNQIYKQFKR